MKSYIRKLLTILLSCWSLNSSAAESFIDVHIHYNWDQAELVSTKSVIQKLQSANIHKAIVSSIPSKLALDLSKEAPGLIIPFFSPYIHPAGKHDWFLNPKVVKQAEAGLKAGYYQGIGELHFMAGFRPKTSNPVFLQLMQLAKEFRKPVLIHIDAANETVFLSICQRFPGQRILFAHAGGSLHPPHIKNILQKCPNVWVEFSARDPWRYGGLTNDKGSLLEDWRKLILAYPDRFMTGTDPVWRVTRTQSWDQADDGWDHYAKLINYQRHWISELPDSVQQKIKYHNPSSFLRGAVPVKNSP